MKIRYLLQISEDNFFVISYGPWDPGIVEGLQITFDDKLNVSAEFFLRFD